MTTCRMWLVAMIAVVIVAIGARFTTADDWPGYQKDNTRNAVTAERLAVETLNLDWSWRSPHPPQPAWAGPAKWDAYAGLRGLRSMRHYDPVFHVVSVGNRVFFGSSVDDSVYCLDATTGKTVWSYCTDGPVRIAPAVADGRLYFGSDDGVAYCLNASDGKLIWKHRPGAQSPMILNNGRLIPFWPIRTGVVVDEGIAYFGASLLPWKTSYLCALDAKTGSSKGKGCYVREFNGLTLEGPLALSPQSLLAPQGRVAPQLFRRTDGKSQGNLKGGGGSFVVITPDAKVLHGPGNKTGWITGSDPKTGAKIAMYKRGNAMLVAGEMSYLLTDTSLTASNFVKRTIAWKVDCPFPYTVILAGDKLFAGGKDQVAAFSRANGKQVWKRDVDGSVYGIAVANGHLLVSTDTGRIYAFGKTDRLSEADPKVRAKPLGNAEVGSKSKSRSFKVANATAQKQTKTARLPKSASPAPLAAGPWLQFTSPTTAVVRWHTLAPSPTILTHKQGDAIQKITDTEPKTFHRVTLTGLRRHRQSTYTINTENEGQASGSKSYPCENFFNYTLGPLSDTNRPIAQSPYPIDALTPLYSQAAKTIIEKLKTPQGICLVWGAGEGRLAYEIAKACPMRVIGLETDAKKVAAARAALKQAGLYGTRVAIHHVQDLQQLPLAGHFANLIVSDRLLTEDRIPGSAKELMRMLKPGGGLAMLGRPADAKAKLRPVTLIDWFEAVPSGPEIKNDGQGVWASLTRAPLEGAGEWTHLYGNPDNSAFGGETLSGVRKSEDLDVQWIGRPGPRFQADRNGRKPSPLSAGGRLFLQGLHRIAALDAHNGSILWSLEIPDLERFNMPRDCGNWCTDGSDVYAAIRGKCWQIDAATGEVVKMHDVLAAAQADWKFDWGYLASHDDLLIGSAVKQGTSWTNFWGRAGSGWYDAKSGAVTHKVCSDNLFATDKKTGKPIWKYTEGVIINSSITIGQGSLYFVETRNKDVKHAKTRRVGMHQLWLDQYLVALDVKTGKKLWESAIEIPDATVVFYLAHGKNTLALVGSGNKNYHISTFNATTGDSTWKISFPWASDHHGGHMSRPAVIDNVLYVRPRSFLLETGKPLAAKLPSGRCGTYACTSSAIFFRSGNVTIWDRDKGSTSAFARLRPDCWLSTIPASGMLLSPEGGGGCSCGKWLETSVGFMPKIRRQLPGDESIGR